MPKSPEQYQQQREKKVKLIKKEALDLFSHESYLSTSISKIANRVGMSKGLFYNYFDSKEQLLESILQEGFDKINKIFTRKDFKLETKEDFSEMINANFALIKEEKEFWKFYMTLALQPAAQNFFNENIMSVLEKYMEVLIIYFTKKGSENPMAEAMLLGGTIDGISLGYAISPEMYPLDDIKTQIIEKFA